ncbi:hypothetical protein Plhal304r1_c019g0066771 [Plasmopara halstedii]
MSSNEGDCKLFDEAMRHYKETVLQTFQNHQDIALDFHVASSERSPSHFFHLLDTSKRKIFVEEVGTLDASVSTNRTRPRHAFWITVGQGWITQAFSLKQFYHQTKSYSESFSTRSHA